MKKIEFNSKLVNKKNEIDFVTNLCETKEHSNSTVFTFNKEELIELLFEYKVKLTNGNPLIFVCDDIRQLFVDIHQYLKFLDFENEKYKKLLDSLNVDYEIGEDSFGYISESGHPHSFVFETITVDLDDLKNKGIQTGIKSESQKLRDFREKIGLMSVY